MKDKVALITGGSGGIGTAIARHLFENGAKVAVAYNKNGDHALAKSWQTKQKEAGYDFTIHYCDVTDFESSAMMVFNIEKELGNIDILVNNAGVTEDVTLKKMSYEQWHKVINTNLDGVFNVTRNVLSKMLEKQYGRIINISSINGQKGQFGQVNYCTSKAGMHGFTKALAQEVARKNITVNTVSPGYVKTKMTENMSQEILNKIINQIPVGRLANPDEVARVVGFLASTQSAFITGANFAINGGQHMF